MTGSWSSDATVQGLRAVAEAAELPREFALYPARPNLFRTATNIRFDVPRAAPVDIEIFDLQGRRVRTLVRGPQAAGVHEAVWNQTNDTGTRAAPGVYLYRMIAGEFRSQRKLVVVP